MCYGLHSHCLSTHWTSKQTPTDKISLGRKVFIPLEPESLYKGMLKLFWQLVEGQQLIKTPSDDALSFFFFFMISHPTLTGNDVIPLMDIW